ncbi:hypothetical protein BOX15_Mlig017774g1, partial [Macrostomum lignano]
ALAIVFAIKRFHQYLFGRSFTIITDHQPLTTIFGPKVGISPTAAGRLQRWALLLSGYSYSIRFRKTAQHSNADGLSRLPLQMKDDSPDDDDRVCQLTGEFPLTAADVAAATKRDDELRDILRMIMTGWPELVPPRLEPYFRRRLELSVEDGCVIWGTRVLVPEALRPGVLLELHVEHFGMARMKSVARTFVWWPGMDADIESVASSCQACQSVKLHPVLAPLHPWVWPDQPWDRIHVDFAGPVRGRQFLLVVDAHSKWPHVEAVSTL